MNLSGKNVLVTGGGGVGVASGVVAALLEAGANVIINEVDHKTLKEGQKRFPNVTAVKADVTSEEDILALFKIIVERHGILHGLVNNAGIGLSRVAHDASEEEFDKIFGINVKGVWRVSRLFAQQLIAAKLPGAIVNISSVHAHSAMSRNALYTTTKNAVVGLTMGMAVELGKHNIRVNAVAPGYVHAEQNYDLVKTWTEDPKQWVQDFINNQQVLHHDIKAIDVGRTAAFLLSDGARSITGQQLFVDAGKTSLLFNRDYTGDAGNYQI